tara:strand:- start:5 stop:1114 length:1110 start_codon:yes stop_codon:yes gene_type:complete
MKASLELQKSLCKYFDIHPSRLDCLCQMIVGIMSTQTSNLTKIASNFSNKAKFASCYRRIQRFFKLQNLSSQSLLSIIVDTFKFDRIQISMDRTNWSFGKTYINYLVFAINYKGYSIPISFKLLPDSRKCGNSSSDDRIKQLDELLKILPAHKITSILGDREFNSSKWVQHLESLSINFHIRFKKNTIVKKDGKSLKLEQCFRNIKTGESRHLKDPRDVNGTKIYFSCIKLLSGELLLIGTLKFNRSSLDEYKFRWQIESCFSAFKVKGLNIESTHMIDKIKLETLFYVLTLSFIWSYKSGEICQMIDGIKFKKDDGYAYKSIIKTGTHYLCKLLAQINLSFAKMQLIIQLVFGNYKITQNRLKRISVV